VQAPGLSRGEWGVVGVAAAGLVAIATAAVIAVRQPDHLVAWCLVVLLIVAGCAIAGLLVMSLSFSQRIAIRVRVLREVAQELGGGDFGVRAPAEPNDDLGALGLSLNTMADRIARVLKAQKDLLAGISHELRSPLARIQVAIELIRIELEGGRAQAPDGNDRRKSTGESLLNEIQEEVGLLERHIRRLLEAQRVGQDKTLVQREPVPVDALLRKVVERDRNRLDHLGFQVELELALGDAAVSGDSNALDRVVSTLIENVVQHASDGGSARAIRVESVRDELGALVRVHDHGAGLPTAECVRVFDAFYRADPSRNNETGGTGLGLYLVRKICEAHGGSARAYPRQGGGLTVELRLPLPGRRELKETVKVAAVHEVDP
jgi:signal transduction histidine kinase